MAIDPVSLYFGSPVWLQNTLLSLYGLRLQRRRYGGEHRATLAALRDSQWFTADRLEADQLLQLNTLLLHAGRTTPRYRELGLGGAKFTTVKQLREIPTLSKDDLRANPANSLSDVARGRKLVEIHTGGTTGTPLTVLCDQRALQRNYAFFARLREWAGITRHARVATFAGRTLVSPKQSSPPFWRHNRPANTVLYSSYHLSPSTLPAYVEHLAEWKPELIDSYPSSIEPIARYLVSNGIDRIRPKAIITSSETLAPTVRAVISEAFGAPVFDHYGSAEMGAFISQCERGSYHANSEFGIVEILRDGQPAEPGQSGEIVATGFVNRIMPLIRYRTGDMAMISDKTCTCGRSFPVIEELMGRIDDVIITPEGRRIGRLDPIFKAVDGFYEARIVQDKSDHVRVEYVAGEELVEDQRRIFTRELSNRLGPSMRIDVVRVDRIPRTRGGKLRMVVNELPR